MAQNSLLFFLAIVIVLFIIVFALMAIGFFRTNKPQKKVIQNQPGIAEDQQPIAERLGEQQPDQYGEDPRGDDVGGNFGGIGSKKDAKL